MKTTRREFMKTVGCGAVALGMPQAVQDRVRSDRPNIVIVLADDMTWSDCEPYGSPNVKTPNMRKLAEQGMRFDNMFTTTAMSAPSRQQLYTGLFPVRNGAYPNHSSVYEGTKSIAHHLSDLGYRVALSGKKHFGPPGSFPFEKQTLEALLESDERPFCHILASRDPHKPWSAGDAQEYSPDEIAVPPNLIDTPAMRRSLREYYAEISHLDKTLGRVMKALDDAGERDNTLLIFTSEQGMTLPFGGKWLCYDTGLRTAFIARWPGRVAPGSATDALVQYVDVVPTLVEIAGGDPEGIDTGCAGGDGRTGFDGRSFLGLLDRRGGAFRDVVYGVQTTEGIKNGTLYPVRSIRNGRYKYIRNLNHTNAFTNVYTEGGKYHDEYFQPLLAAGEKNRSIAERLRHFQHRPAEEMYDLRKDPFELTSVADDPDLAEIKARLKGRLEAWMKEQGDQGLETEKLALARQKNKKGG